MKLFAKCFAAIALTAMGMAGLWFKVEYAGWVLATGLLVAAGI